MHVAILTRQIGHYHDARYRAAAQALNKVTIVSTANQGGFSELLARDLGAYDVERVFDNRLAYDQAVRDKTLSPRLKDAMERLRPDAIAVAGWTAPESAIAIQWARGECIPVVIMSETQADDAHRSVFRETIKARIVSQCQAALVGGPSHAAYITRLGIPSDRIHFGYNAVDNAYFASGAEQARSNASALRITYRLPERYVLASARFIAKKNLPTLVTAYAQARAEASGEVPNLVILGAGPEREVILEAAQTGGVVEKVHLPGFVGYDILPMYYGLAEGFAHVSTVEQWGLVVNEAMASGLPVVVSGTCGVARTVVTDGISGLIARPDVESIASALTQLFTMSNDERDAVGAAASRAISCWGPDRFGQGLDAAVQSARTTVRPPALAPWDRWILARMARVATERVA